MDKVKRKLHIFSPKSIQNFVTTSECAIFLRSLVRPDRGSNPQSTALEVNTDGRQT